MEFKRLRSKSKADFENGQEGEIKEYWIITLLIFLKNITYLEIFPPENLSALDLWRISGFVAHYNIPDDI